MKFIKGDIWAELKTGNYDAVLIPTNGGYNRHGEAIMGAGLARQARDRYPGIEKKLGFFLKTNCQGTYDPQWKEPWNVPYCIGVDKNLRVKIFSFPTKPTWAHTDAKNKHILGRYREEAKNQQKVPGWQAKSDLLLIGRSAELISKICEDMDAILLPGVGTGHGELKPNEVVPVLQEHFDDRFFLIVNL
jgi:hypothetical protein